MALTGGPSDSADAGFTFFKGATTMTPRDAEEKRLQGGTITPVARDAEEKRITGLPVATSTSRDSEEKRIKGK
jgi:hypothetical protein